MAMEKPHQNILCVKGAPLFEHIIELNPYVNKVTLLFLAHCLAGYVIKIYEALFRKLGLFFSIRAISSAGIGLLNQKPCI